MAKREKESFNVKFCIDFINITRDKHEDVIQGGTIKIRVPILIASYLSFSLYELIM